LLEGPSSCSFRVPGKGDGATAAIAATILSGAVTWGADSAVIAEIVPRLKCFLKQGARGHRLTVRAKQHIRWLGCGAPQRGLPTPCNIDPDETHDHPGVGARTFFQGRCG
jgi:hypothetical protein